MWGNGLNVDRQKRWHGHDGPKAHFETVQLYDCDCMTHGDDSHLHI